MKPDVVCLYHLNSVYYVRMRTIEIKTDALYLKKKKAILGKPSGNRITIRFFPSSERAAYVKIALFHGQYAETSPVEIKSP